MTNFLKWIGCIAVGTCLFGGILWLAAYAFFAQLPH